MTEWKASMPFVFTEEPQLNRRKKIEECARVYHTIAGFELRFGKFYDPNLVRRNEEKQEIRIICDDHKQMEVLYDLIREWLTNKTPKESAESK